MIFIIKSCCVTGHRKFDKSKIKDIERNLRREIIAAILDDYRAFISGFEEGVDLLFAKLVREYRDSHDIYLGAALAYPKKHASKEYEFLLSKCNGIKEFSPKHTRFCYSLRNQYMINECDRVIAVYDGRETGGTVDMIRYAQSKGREIRMINI